MKAFDIGDTFLDFSQFIIENNGLDKPEQKEWHRLMNNIMKAETMALYEESLNNLRTSTSYISNDIVRTYSEKYWIDVSDVRFIKYTTWVVLLYIKLYMNCLSRIYFQYGF